MIEVLDKLLQVTDVYLSKVLNRGIASAPTGEEEMEEDDDLVITSQPSLIHGQMRSYQIEGLDWLAQLTRNGMNGILADEMGLGKTLQSISILALAKEREWKEDAFPHLIVCPKSTISNWEKEFHKFCPSFSTCCLIGSQEERQQIIDERIRTGDFKVLITSFDVCRIEISTLKRVKFGYFILDEAHRIKNEESILSSIVRLVSAERIFLLTGTPLQNNLHELWAILNFIMPQIFDSSEDFDYIFNRIVQEKDQESVASTLHRILRPFMLRRLKADVARDLPEKKELYVYVSLSPLQQEIYKDIVLKNADSVLNSNKSVGKTRLVNTLMQLRKCCNHPYLFNGIEPGPPYREGPHLVENSGKLAVLDKVLNRIFELGDKNNQVLIFSQMTRMMDILDDFCRYRNIAHSRIDGSTASSDRQRLIDEFTSERTDKKVFLLSTRAGGLGINLTSANFVIIFDADFNPQSDLQAIDRAHRIGQKRPVTVYRFVTRNTVEEKIMEKAARKMMIDKLVIRKTNGGGRDDVSKEEIGQIIRFGINKLFDNNNEIVLGDEDIDALLEFSEKRTNEFTEQIKSNFDSFVLKFENPSFETKLQFEEEITDDTLPEEVKIAAQTAASITLNGIDLDQVVEGPRERKPILPLQKKEAVGGAPPVIKTKLAEWRAKVGGGHEYQFFEAKRLDELEFMGRSLNRNERAEQEKLLAEGFPNFPRRCFHTVIRMLEDMGPSESTTDQICFALPDRSPEEIKRYVETLFRRGKNFLGEHFMIRFLNKVRRVEQQNEKIDSLMDALSRKINEIEYTNVWLELPVDSAYMEEHSAWTNDADRIILCGLYYFGYGSWSSLKQLLSLHPRTSFNLKLLCKKSDEIKQRADELLEIVLEEFPKKKRNSKK